MEPKIGILSYSKEQGKGTGEVRRIVRNKGSKVGNKAQGITRRCVKEQVRNRAGFWALYGNQNKGQNKLYEKAAFRPQNKVKAAVTP